MILAGTLAALALAATVWAVVVKIQSRDGTVVLHLSEPGSQVEILDEAGNVQITRRGEAGTLRISVDPGKHRLKVEKEGFQFYTEDFTIESRGTKELEARLEPLKTAVAGGRKGVLYRGEHSLAQMLASGEWEWAPPENLGPIVNSGTYDGDPDLSRDGLTLMFGSWRRGGYGKSDLHICRRPTINDPWSEPRNLGPPINSGAHESRATISADGLTLVFTFDDQPGGKGGGDLRFSTRPSREAAWEEPIPFEFNTADWESDPFLTANGLSLLFSNGLDLMICTRESSTQSWSAPASLGQQINSRGYVERGPWLSDDGLVLLFDRANADQKTFDENKSHDLWMSTRGSTGEAWAPPVRPGINSSERDVAPSYSPAEQALYFASERPGGHGGMDLWMSRLVRKQNGPPPAVAPFTPDEARKHQERWAAYLGVPVEHENSIGMKLVLIPPGELDMGSTQEEIAQLMEAARRQGMTGEYLERVASEAPRHRVKITRPFYLGRHEVTVGQFRRFVEGAGYKTEPERDGRGGRGWNAREGRSDGPDPKYNWRSTGFPQDDNHPVVNVTSSDAVEFCNWLRREEGRPHRLPTEAEWEYACRAGSTTKWSFGDDGSSLGDYAWYEANSGSATHPVGQKRPNGWGLLDMYGNVWEWCSDWYEEKYYGASPSNDPVGPSLGTYRVVRGGSCYFDASLTRSANRLKYSPVDRVNDSGFRVVRRIEVPSGKVDAANGPTNPPRPISP